MQTYKYPIATRRLHTISLFLIAALFIITIVVTIKFSSTTIIEAINPTKKEEIHFIVSKKIPETLSIDDTNCPDGTLPNPLWQKAYRNPRFCNDTYEHGIFNLNTLQKSLSIKNIACGSYCIFLPSKNIFPPTSSLGWALKQQSKDDDSPAAATACWSEIGYFDDCMENWKEYQKRVERTGGTDMISTAELLHLSLPPQSEKEEQQHSLAFECDPIITGQEGTCLFLKNKFRALFYSPSILLFRRGAHVWASYFDYRSHEMRHKFHRKISSAPSRHRFETRNPTGL